MDFPAVELCKFKFPFAHFLFFPRSQMTFLISSQQENKWHFEHFYENCSRRSLDTIEEKNKFGLDWVDLSSCLVRLPQVEQVVVIFVSYFNDD